MTEEITKLGVNYKDYLKILPFEGNQCSIRLMKSKYILTSDRLKKGMRDHIYLSLPEPCEIELKIDDSLENCFYLKSEKTLFKINGNFVREAYLMKGDKVQIGYNFLYFQKIESNDLECNLPEAIIDSDFGILLIGASGSGKTKLAKEIHDKSKVRGKFVHLNLSSYAESLIESEIFGHSKGAFTGASSHHHGALSEAEHGTLFFDEIDSLPLNLQVKLLLFLDNKKYKSVGDVKEKTLNTRMIFSSGQDLEHLVKTLKMRKDFYFRINSLFKVHLPNLCEKKSLIKEFLQKFSQEQKIKISDELNAFYQNYKWPGNYRQLNEHMKQKYLLSNKKQIDFCFIDRCLFQTKETVDISEVSTLEEASKKYFLKVYQGFKGHKNLVKTSLNISEYRFTKLLESSFHVDQHNFINS